MAIAGWLFIALWLGVGIYLILHFWLPVDSFAFRSTLTVLTGIGAVLIGVYSYRKQRLQEGASVREDEAQFLTRYNSATDQLAHDKPAARLAGVYAMARLADDWEIQRQQCVDVLCAYLRMPPEADEHDQEVRSTILRVIADHLLEEAVPCWSDLNYNLDRADLRNANLDFTNFRGEVTSFVDATFSGKRNSFFKAKFSSKDTSFDGATFSGGTTSFYFATFSGEHTSFEGSKFSSENTSFIGSKFTGIRTSFEHATFGGTRIVLSDAKFRSRQTVFIKAEFTAKDIFFDGVDFGEESLFFEEIFTGEYVSFRNTKPAANNFFYKEQFEPSTRVEGLEFD